MHCESPRAGRRLRTGNDRERAADRLPAAVRQTAIEREQNLATRDALAQRTKVENTRYRIGIESGGKV